MNKESSLAVVILAAGKGKRMKSDLPKVMHAVAGKPMIEHVIDQAKGAGAEKIIVVLGHKREMIIPLVEKMGVNYVIQEEQLGTGHAVKIAEGLFEEFEGNIIVLSGDVPLLSQETIQKLKSHHEQKHAFATMLTAIAPDPTGYGRVIRDDKGQVLAVQEHKDCSPDQLKIDEINSGIYVFESTNLFETLKLIKNDNAQGEYYLPDVFKFYLKNDKHVEAVAGTFDEIHGVNSQEDLKKVDKLFK